MDRIYFLILLGLVCVWLNASAQVCDRSSAMAALERAQRADPAERLGALDESIAVCPSYRAWLMKGGAYFALQQYEKAIEALKRARQLADNNHLAGLALARIAQVYAYRQDYTVAQNLIDKAYRELDRGRIPDWLPELRQGIDQTLADQVMDAQTIQRTLINNRNFAVEGTNAEIDLQISFDFDKDTLTAQGTQQVQELGKALEAFVMQEGYQVRLIGHTDAQGDDSYNQALSERRALRVSDELARSFPTLAQALIPEGRGERELRYQEDTDQAHRFNRRVEVELYR